MLVRRTGTGSACRTLASAEMGLVTSEISYLRSALDGVPVVLLDDDLQRVLSDALAAVDALEVFTVTPAVVVVVGASGSGKSTIVNALVGSHVAEVSALRPTTTTVTAIVGSGLSPIEGVSEYLITEGLDSGVAVVDTPPWDATGDLLHGTLAAAALAIVVVTPSRYGDEATRHAMEAASKARDMKVMVNRIPEAPELREQLEDAIHERLGVEPYAVFVEGSPVKIDGALLASVPRDLSAHGRKRVLQSAAGGASRRVASGLTEAATQVGTLQRALGSASEPASEPMDGLYDWEEARGELVRIALQTAADFDASVETMIEGELAHRIREQLPPVDAGVLAAALDDWLDDTRHRFRRRATFRFRKKSTRILLDRWAWVASVAPDAVVPRRLRRIMREAYELTVRKSSVDLLKIVNRPAVQRSKDWADVINIAGEYRPGMLFAAASVVDGKDVPDR